MRCRNGSCRNQARYFVQNGAGRWSPSARYCGICDIECNDGKGRLARELTLDQLRGIPE